MYRELQSMFTVKKKKKIKLSFIILIKVPINVRNALITIIYQKAKPVKIVIKAVWIARGQAIQIACIAIQIISSSLRSNQFTVG